MITKMTIADYRGTLHARLCELEANHEQATEAYRKKLATWRKRLLAWIRSNAAKRVAAAVRKRHYDSFDTDAFFSGAPVPPEPPDTKLLEELRAMARQLRMTRQKTIQINTKDVQRLFGDDQ